jgi:hypothetical protein
VVRPFSFGGACDGRSVGVDLFLPGRGLGLCRSEGVVMRALIGLGFMFVSGVAAAQVGVWPTDVTTVYDGPGGTKTAEVLTRVRNGTGMVGYSRLPAVGLARASQGGLLMRALSLSNPYTAVATGIVTTLGYLYINGQLTVPGNTEMTATPGGAYTNICPQGVGATLYVNNTIYKVGAAGSGPSYTADGWQLLSYCTELQHTAKGFPVLVSRTSTTGTYFEPGRVLTQQEVDNEVMPKWSNGQLRGLADASVDYNFYNPPWTELTTSINNETTNITNNPGSVDNTSPTPNNNNSTTETTTNNAESVTNNTTNNASNITNNTTNNTTNHTTNNTTNNSTTNNVTNVTSEPIELPDDYAREQTAQQTLEELKQEGSTVTPAGFPELPEVRTMEQSAKLIWDSLTGPTSIYGRVAVIEFSAGDGTCPTWAISVFDGSIMLDYHCHLYQQIKPALSAVFMAIWGLVALMIILTA